MDKAEYISKLEQINSLAEAGDFRGASDVADEIDWRHVKSVRTLSMIGEIYEANHRYEESLRVMKYAYRRSASSKTVLYRICELDIRTGDFDEAKKFLNEFEQNSPNDTSRYILKYKLLRAEKAPLDDQIQVLREYKNHEYTERWAYELAKLYLRNGQKEKCIEECDDMILWFSEGKYVTKAMELKMQLDSLTPSQQIKYDAAVRRQAEEKAALVTEEQQPAEEPVVLNGMETVEKAVDAAEDEEEEKPKVSAEEAITKMDEAAGSAIGDRNVMELKAAHSGEETKKKEKSGSEKLQHRLLGSIRAVFSGIRPVDDAEDEDADMKIAAEPGTTHAPLPIDTAAQPEPAEPSEADAKEAEPAVDAEALAAAVKSDGGEVRKLEQEAEENASSVAKRLTRVFGKKETPKSREEAQDDAIDRALDEEKPDTLDLEKLFAETAGEFASEVASGHYELTDTVVHTPDDGPETAAGTPEAEEDKTEETAPAEPASTAKSFTEQVREAARAAGIKDPDEESRERQAAAEAEKEAEAVKQVAEAAAEPAVTDAAEAAAASAARHASEEDEEDLLERLDQEEMPEEPVVAAGPATVIGDTRTESAAAEAAEHSEGTEESPETEAAEHEDDRGERPETAEHGEDSEERPKAEPAERGDDRKEADSGSDAPGTGAEPESGETAAEAETAPDETEKDGQSEKDETGTVLSRETDESLGLTREFHFQEEIEKILAERRERRRQEAGEAEEKPIRSPEEAAGETVANALAGIGRTADGKAESVRTSGDGDDTEKDGETAEAAGSGEKENGEAGPEPAQPEENGTIGEDGAETPVREPQESGRTAAASLSEELDSIFDGEDSVLSTAAVFAEQDEEGGAEADEELLKEYGETASAEDAVPPEETSREQLMNLAPVKDPAAARYEISDDPDELEKVPVEGRKFTAAEAKAFSYFAKIPGIDYQATSALADVHNHSGDKTSRSGNIAIMGRPGSGKTRLADALILSICLDLHIEAAKVGKIVSDAFNKKDPAAVVKKLAGGFLLIEAAGALSDEAVERLGKAMEFRTDDLVVILEDEKQDLRRLFSNHPDFAAKFTSRITVPVFTNDELVGFGKVYAKENGYKLDEMATLALYTMIGDNQKDAEPVTVGRVRDMLDRAIDRSGRKFRFGKGADKEDGLIVLHEKDFNF